MDGEWPFQRGNQIPFARAVWIGANDARHREHLMAPARQLTSSASLNGKEVVEPAPGRVKHLVARMTLRLSRRNLIETNKGWTCTGHCSCACRCRRQRGLVGTAIVQRVCERFTNASVRSAGPECVAAATAHSAGAV